MHSLSVAVLSGEWKCSAIALSLNVHHTVISPVRAWQCSLASSTSTVPLFLTEDVPSHAEEDSCSGRPYRQDEAPALPQPSCHGAVHVPGQLPGTVLACSVLESVACCPASFKLKLRPSTSICWFWVEIYWRSPHACCCNLRYLLAGH